MPSYCSKYEVTVKLRASEKFTPIVYASTEEEVKETALKIVMHNLCIEEYLEVVTYKKMKGK